MSTTRPHGATFSSRYECKYVVDPAAAKGIRGYLRSFTRPDRYAAQCPEYRYPVNSLYLDSPDLILYAQTVAGEKARFKLRVRTYSDDPESPAFFEVKKKVNSVISKKRAALTRGQAHALLDRDSVAFICDLPEEVQDDLGFFRHYAEITRARPVARIKYLREAYEALGNEPVRVTFDSELMHVPTTDGNLSHCDESWVVTPTGGVVLEIKYTERLPAWAQELIRLFGLNQRAVPKYVLSIDRMHDRRRRAAHPAIAALGS